MAAPVWVELVQLVPVLSLALPFIMSGEVDVSRAASGFLAGALLTLPISVLLVQKRYVLNPILIGTGIWLWLGALAFNLELGVISTWLAEAQGFGLFVAALVVGIFCTLFCSSGYVGRRHHDASWIRKASLGLLALSVVAAVWAFFFRNNVRLGGGLPFIALNVARRVIIARAPPAPPA